MVFRKNDGFHDQQDILFNTYIWYFYNLDYIYLIRTKTRGRNVILIDNKFGQFARLTQTLGLIITGEANDLFIFIYIILDVLLLLCYLIIILLFNI